MIEILDDVMRRTKWSEAFALSSYGVIGDMDDIVEMDVFGLDLHSYRMEIQEVLSLLFEKRVSSPTVSGSVMLCSWLKLNS